MEIEQEDVAPAGVDDGAQAPASLTLDQATERVVDWPDEEPASPEPVEAASEPQEAEPASPDPEPAETEQTNAEADPVIDWDKVPGTAKFRLRDGTEFDGAFVKQNLDRLRQVDRVEREIGQKAAEIQQRAAQFAQQEQYLSQLLPQAIAAMQQHMPQPPEPPEEVPGDYVGNQERLNAYLRAQRDYEGKIGQIRAMQQHQSRLQAQQQQQQRQHIDSYIAKQQQELYRAMPDLRDTAKRQEFQREFYKYGEEVYGFDRADLDGTSDHRILLMARDAIELRKLRANPPKPSRPAAQQPAPATTPVAAPGQRQSAAEGQAAKRAELFQRARSRGGLSLEEATALTLNLD